MELWGLFLFEVVRLVSVKVKTGSWSLPLTFVFL